MTDKHFNHSYLDVYTRADAILDGNLIDISEIAKTEGFIYPVALTVGAYNAIEPSIDDQACGQSLRGRLQDMFWMLRLSIRRSNQIRPCRIVFSVLLQGVGNSDRLDLYYLCHPGDHGEPVITIMLTHEN